MAGLAGLGTVRYDCRTLGIAGNEARPDPPGGCPITDVSIRYFAALREQAGRSGEDLATTATSVGELYEQRRREFGFTLAPALVRFAVNQEYRPADHALQPGDEIVFIPPVNGG